MLYSHVTFYQVPTWTIGQLEAVIKFQLVHIINSISHTFNPPQPSRNFLAGNQLYELKCHRIGWGWGCQKKSIAIFGYKQRLLSLDMKTKLVQHVQSDWMRDWKSVRVMRKSESEREWEWESVRVSFEHRHENKSRSEHSNIHTFLVPSFCLTFRHFLPQQQEHRSACDIRVHRAGSQ